MNGPHGPSHPTSHFPNPSRETNSPPTPPQTPSPNPPAQNNSPPAPPPSCPPPPPFTSVPQPPRPFVNHPSIPSASAARRVIASSFALKKYTGVPANSGSSRSRLKIS